MNNTFQQTFIKDTGAAKIVQPQKVTTVKPPMVYIRRGGKNQNKSLKICLFGPAGTGKTYAIKDLLELGYKVYVLSTDIGGDGLASVEIPLLNAGKEELLENNLRALTLTEYDEVDKFLDNPDSFVSEDGETFSSFNPDVIFWDGFSAFQQCKLSEYVGDMDFGGDDNKKKVPSEAVESGLQFEQRHWGLIRNATVRATDNFVGLTNASGKPLHKVVTCHEKSGSEGGKLVDKNEPLLQGAGAKMFAGAFDIIIKTKVQNKSMIGNPADSREYLYITQGNENTIAKVRGFNVPPQMKAEFGKLFESLLSQLGVKK